MNCEDYDKAMIVNIFGKICGEGTWDSSVYANEKNKYHANVGNLLKAM